MSSFVEMRVELDERALGFLAEVDVATIVQVAIFNLIACWGADRGHLPVD